VKLVKLYTIEGDDDGSRMGDYDYSINARKIQPNLLLFSTLDTTLFSF